MNWVWLAVLFSVSHAAHNLFTKYAGATISPPVSMLITNGISLTGAIAIFLIFKFTGQELIISKSGALWMAAAGLMIIVFEVSFLWMFYNGAPLVQVGVVIRILPLVFVVILGFLLLGESITMEKIAGIALALASVYLLTKD